MNSKFISNKISNELPEFRLFLEDVNIDEQPSFYFGNLGLFLNKVIKSREMTLVDKAFQLVNELLNLNDNEVDGLINIGVLEVLTDTEESQRVASEKLNEKGRLMFFELFDRFHKLF